MADGPEFCFLRKRVFLLFFPRSHRIALSSSFSTLRFIPRPVYGSPALKLNQGDKLGLSTMIFGKRQMILSLKWFYFLISCKWWDCVYTLKREGAPPIKYNYLSQLQHPQTTPFHQHSCSKSPPIKYNYLSQLQHPQTSPFHPHSCSK